ncbi:hypothetical protein HJA90_10525 [Rhizobium bangladeshense]|uniref:hypothetical protein n=1 Tax=Rhizobium bangladeshense TaxID=1138189 RepID=UPI001C83F20D|nr:hypothetical protein [Rhizobium bangladeshense]MBX4884017.1 hypothetical protein [Rhizobium bangladeshense]
MKRTWLDKDGKVARKTDISQLTRVKGPEAKVKRLAKNWPTIEWTFYGFMEDGSSRKWFLTYQVVQRRFQAVAAHMNEQEEKYFAHMGDLFPINWQEVPAKKPRNITTLLRGYLSAEQIAEALATSIEIGKRK